MRTVSVTICLYVNVIKSNHTHQIKSYTYKGDAP